MGENLFVPILNPIIDLTWKPVGTYHSLDMPSYL